MASARSAGSPGPAGLRPPSPPQSAQSAQRLGLGQKPHLDERRPRGPPTHSGDPLSGPGTGVGTSLGTTKPEPKPQLPPRSHLPSASHPEAPGEQKEAPSPGQPGRPSVRLGRSTAPARPPATPARAAPGLGGVFVGGRAQRGAASWLSLRGRVLGPAAVPPAREAPAEESFLTFSRPSAPSLPSGHIPGMGYPCLLPASCLSKP
ncbi:basic salivary proline-rich protein 4-like [Rhinolophus ferrumequinum]|uniref:basic salivary proline-rich protein 4-like n=1 Tax=Rhinolophus ferrumequinum TaxID=59479 RepID=UPI00140F8A2F|nr:basic salivary proline-rich protein 4-like [Rhinolophus ferrumequinum]